MPLRLVKHSKECLFLKDSPGGQLYTNRINKLLLGTPTPHTRVSVIGGT